jgi:threonyl-tRNA synthetase
MKHDIDTIRHSLSHVLAAAVLEMFPEAKLGIGPAVDDGFYYDFDLPRTLIPEDLKILEEKMKKIIQGNTFFEKYDEPKEKAIEFLEKTGQNYKVELVKELDGDAVTFYKTGGFVDLCKGPHVSSTSDLKNVGWKLDKIAGAYWKGSEKNKMLQRIYALAFESEEELKDYLARREEALKRDHRKLGAELDLFSFHDEGPGFAFLHPKGITIWNILLDWWRDEHKKAGYTEIRTPILLERSLWENSGHWDHYKENMYMTKIDDRDFAIKPMNCPGGMLYYKEKLHSYREFPLKIAEVGLVHRHELAGVLHGLLRVRSFWQDDAHVFCTEKQIEDEVNSIFDFTDKMYKRLGLKYHVELSTRPESGSIGSDEMWRKAEAALTAVLKKRNEDYKLNPGDGAFYGPKIDFHIEDAIGRTWQLGTIQLDFAMPDKFDLEYIAENGKKERPVMLHRVVFGGIERFLGILIEHFAGAFPAWLAPVQVAVLPISDKHLSYAKKISKELEEAGARVEIDERTESIGKKIREAEMQKVPFIAVVGEKEEKAGAVAIRERGKGDTGQKGVKDLIALIN